MKLENEFRINFKKTDSKNKDFAALKARELNKLEKPIEVQCCNDPTCRMCAGSGHYFTNSVWRVGKNTDTQLIVETDSSDEENMKHIKQHLEAFFQYKFSVIKTLHGYHFIGTKRYTTTHEWKYANSLIIFPGLPKEDYLYWFAEMQKIDTESIQPGNEKYDVVGKMEKAGLLERWANIDFVYTWLSIKFEKSTLRISKKKEGDAYEDITEGVTT